jgi:DNA polymerase/3'-5' exonuclease PolX
MDKQRLPYSRALEIAQGAVDDIGEYCERIEIAGSIRRKKDTIGDIEIVCIPRKVQGLDLFGGPGEEINLLEQKLREYHILKGGEKYKQIALASINMDVFICQPETWGMIYTIRTGSADFTHWLVTPRQKGGGMPSNMSAKDGRLWRNGAAVDTPEERDVFAAVGVQWIEPEKRIDGKWRNGAF